MTEWNGIPENPERDGWHWLKLSDEPPEAWLWSTGCMAFIDGSGGGSPNTDCPDWNYLGPCLTPEEVAAREAAAFQRGQEAMRERLASWLMCGCDTDEQARVVAAATTDGPNSAARWRACHRSDCMALIAAEALEMPIQQEARDDQ